MSSDFRSSFSSKHFLKKVFKKVSFKAKGGNSDYDCRPQRRSIIRDTQKLEAIEAALPQKTASPAQTQPDDASLQAARDLLLGQQRLNTRQIAWQPMRRMVSWQPMKRDNREAVIKAVEAKLAEVLRAAELLGVSAVDVLADLKLRNALQQ
uniref:Required for respiratory growth protein 8, mitochondrial n=1 Tax=Steinernema glaseri TaxID=37863 RepID=A0A1I7ZVF2_9BILA